MASRTLILPLMVCLTGSLAAQEQKAKAQALVKEAIAYEHANGREALLKETNQGSGRFHVKGGDDLYIVGLEKVPSRFTRHPALMQGFAAAA
jgi:hydroxyethylthiazole kinase-like sugar kinase family protein